MPGPTIQWKTVDTEVVLSEIREEGRYRLASPAAVTGAPSLAMQAAGQNCTVRTYIGGVYRSDSLLTVPSTTPVAIRNAVGQPLTGQEMFDMVIEVGNLGFGSVLLTTDEPNGSLTSPFTTTAERTAWATANLATLRSGVSTVWGPGNREYLFVGPTGGPEGWMLAKQGVPNPQLTLSVPGAQAANYVFPDQSPNGNDLRVESGNAAAYSTAGYIGTTAAVLGGCRVSRDHLRINLFRDSFLVAFSMKRATAGADAPIFAIGTSVGEYIMITHKTTGYTRVVCTAATGGAGGLDLLDAASPVDILVSDASATEHHIAFAWNAKTRMAYKYVDGVLAYAYTTNALVENGRYFSDVDAAGVVRLGGGADYAASAAAALFRGFQMYKFPDTGLPLNLGEVANKLSRNPIESVSVFDMQFPEQEACISLIGQSNEVGAGSTGWINRTGNSGAGMVDPIGSRGGYNSMWPLLASLAGKRKSSINVATTGYAATGIVDYWVGRCRAYAPGLMVANGSYITYLGKTYKLAMATIASYTALAADPVTGQAGMTWTDLGASIPADTDGAIYRYTDTGRFDPNNLLSYALDRATSAKRAGFRKYGVIISIGQSDARLLASSADYANAVTSAIEYCNSRGVKPFLGFTCYSADPVIGPYMASTIYPGFLAAFADQVTAKGLAYAGADLWAGLGALAAEATPNSDTAALLADNMHLNPVAVTLGARLWDAALANAGF